MPEGVTTAVHIVTLNSSGFRGILNGKFELVIIDIHGRTEMYFIIHKSLSCEMTIYHVLSCTNRICCSRYRVISTLCNFRFKEELSDLYSLPNIVRVVKSRRMRWAGHVARMG